MYVPSAVSVKYIGFVGCTGSWLLASSHRQSLVFPFAFPFRSLRYVVNGQTNQCCLQSIPLLFDWSLGWFQFEDVSIVSGY